MGPKGNDLEREIAGKYLPDSVVALSDGHANANDIPLLRDRLMIEMDALYPGYGFARHKGYGTAFHQEALERHGPSPLHRRSFAPIRALLARQEAA